MCLTSHCTLCVLFRYIQLNVNVLDISLYLCILFRCIQLNVNLSRISRNNEVMDTNTCKICQLIETCRATLWILRTIFCSFFNVTLFVAWNYNNLIINGVWVWFCVWCVLHSTQNSSLLKGPITTRHHPYMWVDLSPNLRLRCAPFWSTNVASYCGKTLSITMLALINVNNVIMKYTWVSEI